MIYESAGMHASLLGFSLESLVIDNDIIGATQRTIKGIEVNDERLSFETIKDVCLNGPGHFLGSDQTLQLMQTEYLYPGVGDRKSPNEWNEQGALDVAQRAMAKVEEILGHHFPSHVAEAVDAEIRRRFPGEARPGAHAAARRFGGRAASRFALNEGRDRWHFRHTPTSSSSAAASQGARSPIT